MDIKFYQIDAFTSKIFKGNPAGVCPLKEAIPDELMQNIAAENNLSETAFILQKEDGLNIRWFSPTCEIDLCGHATLASSFALFNHEGFAGDLIEFTSRSGILRVAKKGDLLELDFPAEEVTPCGIDPIIEEALGKAPKELYQGSDMLAVFDSAKDIADFKPDFKLLTKLDARGLIVTAKGDDCDFVSRFFGPNVGIDEDPVTGSAHCILTPYWAKKSGKKEFSAKQLSARGGKLHCTLENGRVKIAGNAALYMTGTINI